MSGQWLNQAGDSGRRVAAHLEAAWYGLARPERAARLRQGLIALLLVWVVFALAQAIWALLPGSDTAGPAKVKLLNPVAAVDAAGDTPSVDIDALAGRQLFGKLDTDPAAADRTRDRARAEELAGIERGARETRLDLHLRGIVASTEDGLGHAIIEHRKKQDIYAVDDKLPVSGQVTLAKVMPTQVVLNNGGTYELLKLFDKEGVAEQVTTAPTPRSSRTAPRKAPVDSKQASDLARDYRDRLYSNPQSLAEVVRVSAVREGDQLKGYRVAPGKERDQFEALGLREGDLVTAINGIPLDDPANTVRLYQAMRTAQQATFDVERNGRPATISVSLTESAP